MDAQYVKQPVIRSISSAPIISYEISVRMFDGAAQSNLCGVGCFLILDQDNFVEMSFGCRGGSNSRVELLALWGLLVLEKSYGIQKMDIIGDSIAIINWSTGIHRLKVPALYHWKNRITQLKELFSLLNFCQVSRVFNQRADMLSKKGLNYMDGKAKISIYQKNQLLEEKEIVLY